MPPPFLKLVSSHKRQAKGVRDPLMGRYRLWDKGPVAGARRVHVGLIGQGPEPCASVGGGAALDGAAMGLAVGIACWSAVSPRSQINIRSSNHMRCTCGEAERFTASQPFLLSAPVRPHGQTYHFETVASRRGPWWRFTAGPGDRVTLRWVGCRLPYPASLASVKGCQRNDGFAVVAGADIRLVMVRFFPKGV